MPSSLHHHTFFCRSKPREDKEHTKNVATFPCHLRFGNTARVVCQNSLSKSASTRPRLGPSPCRRSSRGHHLPCACIVYGIRPLPNNATTSDAIIGRGIKKTPWGKKPSDLTRPSPFPSLSIPHNLNTAYLVSKENPPCGTSQKCTDSEPGRRLLPIHFCEDPTHCPTPSLRTFINANDESDLRAVFLFAYQVWQRQRCAVARDDADS
ncbi:hypothetical protein EI94DRAFT_857962 [Lactarius quietus]|nr:hypothetical protein EI94DRAFT_857962 [Lactarius quietus]